jgi:hypothetical protein
MGNSLCLKGNEKQISKVTPTITLVSVMTQINSGEHKEVGPAQVTIGDGWEM